MFIIYGYFLAYHDFQSVNEKPKAWPYGPVSPRAKEKVNYNLIPPEKDQFDEIDDALKQDIDKIVETYSKVQAHRLTKWSHENGSPWDKTVKQTEVFQWNAPINDGFIKAYFRELSII